MKALQAEVNYPDSFFDGHEDGSLRSARIVAPLVCDLIHPRSVIDIGCGRGAWLRAFQENGVESVRGLDGDYVSRDKLLIPADCFRPVNLERPFHLDRDFDLAMSLEVGEHLSPRSAPAFVKNLTTAARIVLFSAAIPGQGGTNHVNEAWPRFWERLFEAEGFVCLNPFQRLVRDDVRVEWWYRQNIYLYAHESRVQTDGRLRAELEYAKQHPLEWVHVGTLHNANERLFSNRCLSILRRLRSRVR